MAEMDMKILSTWHRKILKRIYGPVEERGLWRIRTNQELRKLHKHLDIGAYIKNKRMEWIGYVVKWIREGQLRKYLRVNRTQVEDLDWDCWKVWKRICGRWQLTDGDKKAVDREERASVIREAKALRGPQSHGVNIRPKGWELWNILFEISTGFRRY